jgi:hypothetical protein
VVKNTEKLRRTDMPKLLELTRTEADELIDLLEDCDIKKVGIWRHSIAADIRELFGYCSFEESQKRISENQEPVIKEVFYNSEDYRERLL